MPHCVAWSEVSGNTIFLVRDIRFHCIDRFACILHYIFVGHVCYN